MSQPRETRIHPLWWTAILFASIIGIALMTAGFFSGTFRSYVPVTLTSDRAGLVMDPNGKVKLRGFQVGRVAQVNGGNDPVTLKLEIDPDQIKYIPANIQAQIKATTAFGSKYVDLIYPDNPTPQRLSAGAVIMSKNVSTEVNTVFQSLVGVLHQIDPAKLNAILSALAEGLRDHGPTIGQATTDANQVLLALNPRSETVRADWQSLKGFSDTYSAAAQDILNILNAASTTSVTISANSRALDSLLLNVTGLSNTGINLLGPNMDNFVNAVNTLDPTTSLLRKYNPEYTCVLLGATWFIDHGAKTAQGGNGRSVVLDAGLSLGSDPYRYPDNLPIVGAKGGPGGKPGCGSLPDPTKRWPVPYLVTNTGWGTGTDIRVNPGIGFPGYMNYFPVTRGVPEPPSVRNFGGPAPGPIPYPGAPPFGAPQYAPDGTPLYPGLPPAPPPGAPREPGPTPGSEPFVPPLPAVVQPTPLAPPPPPLPPPPEVGPPADAGSPP